MSRVAWGLPGTRRMETGIDRGVLFLEDGPAVPWDGLTAVTENVSGGDFTPIFWDGVMINGLVGYENYQATLEAFMYPDEFMVCDGSIAIYPGLVATAQPRERFNLSYRTLIYNELLGVDYGSKIHFIYNAIASPTERPYKTLSLDGEQKADFSWQINAIPDLSVRTYKPTAHLIVDTRDLTADQLAEFEDIVYGTDISDPQWPTQDFLAEFFSDDIDGGSPVYSSPVMIDGGDPTSPGYDVIDGGTP